MKISYSPSTSFLITLILLTTATWLIGVADIRYKEESVLAFNDGFPGEQKEWEIKGKPENISITRNSIAMQRVVPGRSYAIRTFPLPPNVLNDKIRVRGNIQTLKRPDAIETNKVAAYMIWFHDLNRKAIKYSTAQKLTGDFKQYRAEQIVTAPENSKYFSIVLINRESSGAFQLNFSEVITVTDTTLYRFLALLLTMAWLIQMAFAMIWIVRKVHVKLMIVLGALTTLTIAGVMLPEFAVSNYLLPLYNLISTKLAKGDIQPLGFFYKAGHFLFFLVISIVVLSYREKLELSKEWLVAAMVVFAIGTEGLQLHLYNRSTQLTDVGIDLIGIFLALILVLTFNFFTNRLRS